MNIERIELSAISKLQGFLTRLGYVTPELSSNDKTPSWDGFIRLYNNEDSSSSSDFYKNKKGQIVFVHETIVNGVAKTLEEK